MKSCPFCTLSPLKKISATVGLKMECIYCELDVVSDGADSQWLIWWGCCVVKCVWKCVCPRLPCRAAVHSVMCWGAAVSLLRELCTCVELGGCSRLNKKRHMLSNCLLVPPADCVTHTFVHRHATHLWNHSKTRCLLQLRHMDRLLTCLGIFPRIQESQLFSAPQNRQRSGWSLTCTTLKLLLNYW